MTVRNERTIKVRTSFLAFCTSYNLKTYTFDILVSLEYLTESK